jgi:tetratricopeptide (TPR) repeat protein
MMRRYRTNILPGTLLLLVITAVYFPTFTNGFTNWDDPLHITENAAVTHLAWQTAAQHFVPTTEYMYHPLTMILYGVEWQIGNGDPFIFHLTSFLFHLLNVILVFSLFRKLLNDDGAALFIALLFGIHPMNVEATAWISGRKDILYAFFFLAGMNSYLRYTSGQRRVYIILTYAAFIFGLLSKPTMVVFPFAMILIMWWQRTGFTRTAMVHAAPFFMLAFVYSIFTLWLSSNDPTATATVQLYAWTQRILMVAASFVFYIGKFIMPIGLSALYGYPMIRGEMLPAWYYAAPLFLAAFCWCVFRFRNDRHMLFGAGLYVIPLLLVSQIVPFHNSSLVADRYAYISTIGLAFIVVRIITIITNNTLFQSPWWISFKTVAAILVIVVLSIVSFERVTIWKNAESLFTNVIRNDTDIWLAYGNRAAARIATGDFHGAVADCDDAIRLHPKSGILRFNKGNAYKGLEQYRSAIAEYDSAISLGYDKYTVFFNKANALYALDQFDSAYAYYTLARDLEPRFSQSYVHLGYITLKTFNDPAGAIALFDTALTLQPEPKEAYYYRAEAHFGLRQIGAAMDDLSRSIAMFPSLINDPLVVSIDNAVDSIGKEIVRLDARIDEKSANIHYYGDRARLYRMVGDTLRAKRDERRKEQGVFRRR